MNVSDILKIEEAGFNALVNNIIRNRISKEETKSNGINTPEPQPELPEDFYNNVDDLLNKDERQEQALVRSLIEFGQKLWDENTTVANYIITALDDLEINQMIENKLLITIIEAYRNANNEGLAPNAKFFLYHEDETVKNMVIKLMEEETEISPNWKYYYQGYIATREDLYKEEVSSTLNYLQLRKIKKLMMENQAELEKATDPEQQFVCIQVHQMLKKMEKEITQQTGMVIYK
jgi:DNA primase